MAKSNVLRVDVVWTAKKARLREIERQFEIGEGEHHGWSWLLPQQGPSVPLQVSDDHLGNCYFGDVGILPIFNMGLLSS